jgi:hypothetical protein
MSYKGSLSVWPKYYIKHFHYYDHNHKHINNGWGLLYCCHLLASIWQMCKVKAGKRLGAPEPPCFLNYHAHAE